MSQNPSGILTPHPADFHSDRSHILCTHNIAVDEGLSPELDLCC